MQLAAWDLPRARNLSPEKTTEKERVRTETSEVSSQQKVLGGLHLICQLPLNVTPVFAASSPHRFSGAPASHNSLIDYFEEGQLFCIVCQAGLNLGCLEIFQYFSASCF